MRALLLFARRATNQAVQTGETNHLDQALLALTLALAVTDRGEATSTVALV